MFDPPERDGGLGWAVAIAGAVNNFLCSGFYRSGGIVYVASVDKFGISRSAASWIPTITILLAFTTAPIGTALCKKFSYPSVMLFGGILASSGMFVCFLANRVEYLFIGWGLMFGFGSGLIFVPSGALIGLCFNKRRPMAYGFLLTGAALGAAFVPPFFEILVTHYEFNGATLISCGLTLHYISSSGLIFVALKYMKPAKRRRSQNLEETAKEVKLLEDGSDLNNQTNGKHITKDDTNENQAQVLNHVKTADEATNGGQKHINKQSDKSNTFCEFLDLGAICNHTFLINCAANGLQASLLLALVTLLPDFGVHEVHVSLLAATYLVSACAISDLLTRFVSGWILTKTKCSRSLMCFFVFLFLAAAFLGMSLTRLYVVVMVCSLLVGICNSWGLLLYFEILATCQSREKYEMAFGFSELVKAPLLLLTTSLLGTLKDATGSYTVTLLIFGGLTGFAASLWILEYFLSLRKGEKFMSPTER